MRVATNANELERAAGLVNINYEINNSARPGKDDVFGTPFLREDLRETPLNVLNAKLFLFSSPLFQREKAYSIHFRLTSIELRNKRRRTNWGRYFRFVPRISF